MSRRRISNPLENYSQPLTLNSEYPFNELKQQLPKPVIFELITGFSNYNELRPLLTDPYAFEKRILNPSSKQMIFGIMTNIELEDKSGLYISDEPKYDWKNSFITILIPFYSDNQIKVSTSQIPLWITTNWREFDTVTSRDILSFLFFQIQR